MWSGTNRNFPAEFFFSLNDALLMRLLSVTLKKRKKLSREALLFTRIHEPSETLNIKLLQS